MIVEGGGDEPLQVRLRLSSGAPSPGGAWSEPPAAWIGLRKRRLGLPLAPPGRYKKALSAARSAFMPESGWEEHSRGVSGEASGWRSE